MAVLHYASIGETAKGEPPEIFPFLGSSRLQERADASVYNVALPLLARAFPDRPPYRLVTLPAPR